MDIWPTVHAERKALAADLRGLADEDWAKPSLCGDWTVRDVLAHMTSAGKLTPPAFFGQMIGSGFSFDKVQEKGIAAQQGATPADTLANFESVLTSVKHPPGPNPTWLGEVIVHSEDIRRPLGIPHKYPTDAVVSWRTSTRAPTCSSAPSAALPGSPCSLPTRNGVTVPDRKWQVPSCRWSWP